MAHAKPNLKRGEAMLVATIFFLVISLTIILGLASPTVRAQKMTRELFFSRQSYYLAEGGMEDVVYRMRQGLPVGSSESLSLGGATVTTVTSDSLEGKGIVSTGTFEGSVRKVATELILGEGVAFHYGIQIGNGGFNLAQNAGVNGNIYSNGSVTGQNGSFVTGSVSAVNSISGVIVGTGTVGDANAPTVNNSTVRGSLYCKAGSGNNKPCNTSGVDPITADLPIPDGQITVWKDEAALGGTIGGQNLSGTTNILGPTKINGDLTLGINSRLTVTGTLWVTGNIILNNGSDIALDASYGAGDGIIVVDGTTVISNGATFTGSGDSRSYVMLLSTNTGATALTLENNVSAAILYVPYGTVQVMNNANFNQVTAKTVSLNNNAVIDYVQGHIDAGFVNGPSGGYDIREWEEI
jgi:hypothetical protein